MMVPDAWPGLVGSAADWGGTPSPRPMRGRCPTPRPGLGGSGAINAMPTYAATAVYDAWAAGGAAGWGYADLLPYFKRSEDAPGRDPALRGAGGPVRVAPVPEPAGTPPPLPSPRRCARSAAR